jgi:hypothetical protein
VQVAGAAVVAESLPEAQHLLFGGGGQVAQGGEGVQEAVEVRHDGGDGRLLKHDLADPDVVRVAAAAPGQVAPSGLEPGEQALTDPAAQSGRGSAGLPGRPECLGKLHASDLCPGAAGLLPARPLHVLL